MPTKEQSDLELELAVAASNLEESIDIIVQRITDMKCYEESGSVEADELETIRDAGEQIRRRKPGLSSGGGLAGLVSGHASRREVLRLKAGLERDLAETEALHQTLDSYAAKFRKYNLPGRDGGEPIDPYLENLSDFMRVTWQEPAEESRRRGHRCLMEWMAELSASGDEKSRATSEALRAILVEIGTRVSHFLVSYFLERDDWCVYRRLREAESVISCLSIEKESVVVEGFLAVMRFIERTMRSKERREKKKGVRKRRVEVKEESKVLRSIVMEIVRLEVSFRSPDLPMMLLDEVFVEMGKHLTHNVFKDKLKSIEEKLGRGRGRGRSRSQDSLASLEQIWGKLDITGNIDSLLLW